MHALFADDSWVPPPAHARAPLDGDDGLATLAGLLAAWPGASLEAKLGSLLRTTLCSFEEAVQRTWADAATFRGLFSRLGRQLGVLQGLPEQLAEALERVVPDEQPGDGRRCIVVATALRRIIAAELVAQCMLGPAHLLRWPETAKAATPTEPHPLDRGAYAASLFVETHTDLLVAALRFERVDDAFFLEDATAALRHVYPLPHRVVCFEELPDLTVLLMNADLTFDGGRNKKPTTLLQRTMHNFLCKQMNQICALRHLVPTLCSSIELFPAIGSFLKLVLRVTLTGSLPGATHRMQLAGRLRLALSLADNPLTGEESPFVQRELVPFLQRTRHVVLFMMHEYFVGVCEADHAADHLFDRDSVKWHDYKAVTRVGNGIVRRTLQQQSEAAFWLPTNWVPVERDRAMGASTPDIINRFHTVFLTTCKKIKKGPADQLIYKRMIAVEPQIIAHHAAAAIAADRTLSDFHDTLDRATAPDLAAALDRARALGLDAALLARWAREAETHAQGTVREAFELAVLQHAVLPAVHAKLRTRAHAFHLIARDAARASQSALASPHEREVIPLRWLQVLGLSRAQADTVRHWVHDYYAYDKPDNKYKQAALALGKESLYAHMAVKLYFRLFRAYRRETLVFRPADEALRIFTALRDRARLLPGDATPPELGRSLYCQGCHRWATAQRPAPLWVTCHYDAAAFQEATRKWEAAHNTPMTVHHSVAAPRDLGASDHMFDLRDGERYCVRSKRPKTQLLEQRNNANAAMQATAAADRRNASGSTEADASGGRDSDSDDGEDEDGEEEEEEEAAADEDDDLDLQFDAHGLPVLRAMPPNPLAGEDEAAPGPRASAHQTQRAIAKRLRDNASRLLEQLGNAVLKCEEARADVHTCSKTPLLSVDLVGVWFQRGAVTWGHCVYCGDLTTVEDGKITNLGLSCMNHAHAEFPHDHPHTLAFTPPAVSALRLSEKHPQVLDQPVACAFCRRYQTKEVVYVYDGAYRCFAVPLCKVDLGAVRGLAPTLQIGRQGGVAVEPMFLGDVVRDLIAQGNRRAAGNARQAARAPAPNPPAVSAPDAPRAPASAPKGGTKQLERRVLGHPRFEEVLRTNEAAQLAFATLHRVQTATDAESVGVKRRALGELLQLLDAHAPQH